MNAPHAKKRTTLRTLNNISDKTPLLTSDSTSTTCFPGSRNLPIVRIVALRLEGTNLSELPGIKNQKPEVHARAGTGSFGIDRDLPRWGLEPAERGGGTARNGPSSRANKAGGVAAHLPRLSKPPCPASRRDYKPHPWRNKPDDSLQYC